MSFVLNEKNDGDDYKIEALLVISNSSDLMKTEILSDIRAVEGVTRVHVNESLDRAFYEISKITLKINTFPFSFQPLSIVFEKIRRDILKINGVRRLTYLSKPTRIGY